MESPNPRFCDRQLVRRGVQDELVRGELRLEKLPDIRTALLDHLLPGQPLDRHRHCEAAVYRIQPLDGAGVQGGGADGHVDGRLQRLRSGRLPPLLQARREAVPEIHILRLEGTPGGEIGEASIEAVGGFEGRRCRRHEGIISLAAARERPAGRGRETAWMYR